MKKEDSDLKLVTKLMFRLLPVQILLGIVCTINGMISSYFAGNFVGVEAMSAVGLYSPASQLQGAFTALLAGGSAIVCGKYLGRNDQDKVRNVFSLNLLLAAVIAVIMTALLTAMAIFDLTDIFTQDPVVRPLFDRYVLGQAIGIFPAMVGNQLTAYLAMENRQKRAMSASLIYIAANLVLDVLFVQVLHMEAFGLALASSLGLWVFMAVQAHAYTGGRSSLHFTVKGITLRDGLEILSTGLPGAMSCAFQTVRRLIVNHLVEITLGSVAISAFVASDSLLAIFWAIPSGMLAVSRMMISISVGEEDRRTLTDVMRVMFLRFVPLMCVVAAGIMLCAEPFTRVFFRDPTQPIYHMTVQGFRILPLCMPLAIVSMHFVCYGQTSHKQVLVHLLSLLDGVVCVAGFTALLIRPMGMNGLYVANVLNGVVCVLVIIAYAWIRGKRFPTNMEQLMVIPKDFGVKPNERIDITVRSMDQVMTVSRRIAEFCRERGIDERRSYLASLCMEEMAGNIVAHGFTKDKRKHSIDIRVSHLDDDTVLLRIRDDCVPFNPQEREDMTGSEDRVKNVGLRVVFNTAESVEYQNLLGMNVLTMKI